MRSSLSFFHLVLLCFFVAVLLFGCSSKESQPVSTNPTPVPQEPSEPGQDPSPQPSASYEPPEFESLDGQFDDAAVWPLCGRISDNAPEGLVETDRCPEERWGSELHTDKPIASTFGSRLLVSENDRYDFHRGIDLAAPVGTPVFAITDGMVQIAGEHSSFSDPLVQVRHYRPDETSCQPKGCYVSNYMHLSTWVVTKGDWVTKGQLLGHVGLSKSGFAHLHFEIRNAPGVHDPYSSWQRDAIHPLSVLPHSETNDASNIRLSFSDLDTSVALNPKPTLDIVMASGDELDLRRIEITVYSEQGKTYQVQVGDSPVLLTPESKGYVVRPSWFDFSDMNRMYSYKNSSSFPWASFQCDGVYESPYCGVLPELYNPNTHMDQQSETNSQAGDFNGLTIWPSPYNNKSTEYRLSLRFNALETNSDRNLCIRARALDAKGNSTAWVNTGDCSALP